MRSWFVEKISWNRPKFRSVEASWHLFLNRLFYHLFKYRSFRRGEITLRGYFFREIKYNFFLDENLLVLFHWLRWQIVSIVFWNCESLLKKKKTEKKCEHFSWIHDFFFLFVKSLPLFDTELLVLFGRNRLSPLAVRTLALVPQYLAIYQSKSHAPGKK